LFISWKDEFAEESYNLELFYKYEEIQAVKNDSVVTESGEHFSKNGYIPIKIRDVK
jgi:hypothetical protein